MTIHVSWQQTGGNATFYLNKDKYSPGTMTSDLRHGDDETTAIYTYDLADGEHFSLYSRADTSHAAAKVHANGEVSLGMGNVQVRRGNILPDDNLDWGEVESWRTAKPIRLKLGECIEVTIPNLGILTVINN